MHLLHPVHLYPVRLLILGWSDLSVVNLILDIYLKIFSKLRSCGGSFLNCIIRSNFPLKSLPGFLSSRKHHGEKELSFVALLQCIHSKQRCLICFINCPTLSAHWISCIQQHGMYLSTSAKCNASYHFKNPVPAYVALHDEQDILLSKVGGHQSVPR